ncbi:hypothetical protein GCM10017783_21860 [Deinococcus piscis]|uniref:Uncharacterized protein n=2 Tax=Deinococcus piscis TaxID=394230 RepID=A0ABQ3KA57_9DEIO|nr:hypothetical protein GCM10017783_21860 [Deinococcus piscis]
MSLLALTALLCPAAQAQSPTDTADLSPQPVPLSQALDRAGVTVGVTASPAGTAPSLGLRGVRLGSGTLDTSLSLRGSEARYAQSLALPLIGYAEAGAEAQWLWGNGDSPGGHRLAASGVLAAGPVEVQLAGERFTAPLLLLRPLDTLNDPTPDPRSEGSNLTASLRGRLGPGTFVMVGHEWGHGAGMTADLELRPQLWSVDGGPAVLALVNPGDLNPELWAESQGTLTLRLGAEHRAAGAGLRLGTGWDGPSSSTELSAVLGAHREAAVHWRAYDLLGQDSELDLGAALSDAWGSEGGLGTQWSAALLLPLEGEQRLELRGSAGAAGTAARAIYLLPLRPAPGPADGQN